MVVFQTRHALSTWAHGRMLGPDRGYGTGRCDRKHLGRDGLQCAGLDQAVVLAWGSEPCRPAFATSWFLNPGGRSNPHRCSPCPCMSLGGTLPGILTLQIDAAFFQRAPGGTWPCSLWPSETSTASGLEGHGSGLPLTPPVRVEIVELDPQPRALRTPYTPCELVVGLLARQSGRRLPGQEQVRWPSETRHRPATTL